MKRSVLRLSGLMSLALASACGAADSDTTESVASDVAGLTKTGLLPYPVKISGNAPAVDGAGNPLPAWDGSVVELMAADAFAECAAGSPWPVGQTSDVFMQELSTRMNTALCPIRSTSSPDFFVQDTASLPGKWALSRLTPDCNADPSTSKKKALKLSNASRHSIPPRIDSNAERRAKAEYEINFAEVNLCIAQRLREHSSSGEVLFLSALDQRMLLEMIRERAQVAMLQYAAFANIFSSPQAAFASDPYQVVPTLQAWARSIHINDITYLKELGADFATSVQLHSLATRELASLLWRSANAHLTRSDAPGGTPEGTWGAGSWRQRMMALLYGGDPLIEAPIGPTQVWKSWERAEPGDPRSAVFGLAKGTITWPNDASGPVENRDPAYVRSSVTQPEVTTLMSLTRRADVLNLKIAMSESSATPKPAGVDRAASAHQLYKAVEASLRHSECHARDPLSCTYASELTALQNDNVTAAFDTYRLWQRYRIRPSHAEALVAKLAEAIPKVTQQNGSLDATQGSWPGALRLIGGELALVPGTDLGGGADGTWYHVDGKAEIAALQNIERVPLYTRLAAHRIPTNVNATVQAHGHGLVAHMASTEPVRILGAVPALAATRDALRVALLRKPTNVAGTEYYRSAEKVLNLIDASIGGVTLDVHPSLKVRTGRAEQQNVPANVLDGCQPRTNTTTCPIYLQNGTPASNSVEWEIGVTLPVDHEFAAGGSLYAIARGSLPATLAAHPSAKTFNGTTLATTLESATPVQATETTTLTLTGAKSLRHHRYLINLPISATKQSFILKTGSGAAAKYMVLGEDVELVTLPVTFKDAASVSSVEYYPTEGQFLAYEGELGGMAEQAFLAQAYNWSEPAFDGFGLPRNWVPPADPRLLGGNEDAASYYLRSAGSAADQATMAVKQAMEELLKQEADEAALSSARRRAAEIGHIEQRSLCGDENPDCDTGTAQVRVATPGIALDCSRPTIDSLPLVDELTNADDAKKEAFRVDITQTCEMFQERARDALHIAGGVFKLGKPVNELRFAAVPPDFSAYRGGSLQGIYVEQWRALRHVENASREFAAVINAAWARVDEVYRYQAFKKYKTAMACSRDLIVGAISGMSVSAGPGGGLGYSPGPLLQALTACQDAQNEEGIVGESPYASALTEAFARLATQTTVFADSVSTLQTSSTTGARFMQEASLARARADLEASIVADTAQTKFGTYRRYHSYDMWRARALLESARRYGAAARSAIESRFVVSLAELHAAEPFVAAPATWADEIYEYDLDAPSSVGLSAAPRQDGGVYPNLISDYIGNLERFVDGYAIARRTSVAKRDDEMLSLGGPEERSLAADGETRVLTEDARRWQLQCPDGTWTDRVTVRVGNIPPTERSLADICSGARPVAARLNFSLDPWGRVEGHIAKEPFAKRHNVRWLRLAANLVGTGIRDCARAERPSDCYAEPYIPYNLHHTGPAWATNHAQNWRLLDIGSSRIEAGKALAAEQWLDPISNGWSKPYVEVTARTELNDRPLGGGYVLEFKLSPDVRIERIERVQLLIESTYWVSQE